MKKTKKLIDECFMESCPQDFFYALWESELVDFVWKMTLASHSTNSEKTKANLLKKLKEKSVDASEISEKLSELKIELIDSLYEEMPEPHNEEWYSFHDEISSFQENVGFSLSRLFFLKDILLQIDENHPKRKGIEDALKISLVNFKKIAELTENLTRESEKTYLAVFDAIAISRAINEKVSFEEAVKIERKR